MMKQVVYSCDFCQDRSTTAPKDDIPREKSIIVGHTGVCVCCDCIDLMVSVIKGSREAYAERMQPPTESNDDE